MTIEKALEILRTVDGIECKIPGYTTALGTAVQALEKQIPKKPLYRETEYYAYKFAKGIKAPFCECGCLAVDEENDCFTYCPDCGQALDWSDENE